MNPKLSIIVITLNEEDYLPNLLEDINNQSYRDFEVIISDANSTDKTVQIAEEFGAKIVNGGIPSIGRNNGACEAKGKILLFLDADVRLNPDYLKDSLNYFKKHNIDLGGTYFYLPHRNIFVFFNNLGNNFGKFFRNKSNKPALSGDAFFVKTDVFNALKGFNENMSFGEDEDFGERAVKAGFKYGLINKSHKSSGRRIVKVGLMSITLSFILYSLARFSKGERKKDLEIKASKLYGEIGAIK